ncbi:peptidase S41 [Streptococcus iniae]|uniref:S41 family peptidase n=1 Tax=Streptococcus iniae TaxID=1346 RepID=UPI0003072EBF|nr:S41 family peptidase [Streptococcus iniae]ESR08928.1 peptidase S41 [Streptococcus iniae IUSA1]RMI77253.1 peptidase S41 [Streptococcus iniae]HEK4518147.1 peptidase S41 [Streptococcus iniae]
MNKLEIVKQIVKVMAEDSSTLKDTNEKNAEAFLSKISVTMSDGDFYKTVRTYLASFGVISHLGFYQKTARANGFRLRRHGNSLYVISAAAETGLCAGDEILSIDGHSIVAFYNSHKDFFVSKTPERQFLDWSYVVKAAEQLKLMRAGKVFSVKVADCLNEDYDKDFACYYINDETFYVKCQNFQDEEQLANLYKECEAAFKSAKYLMIDVRVNNGGSDSLYFPFLKYALPSGVSLRDIDFPDDYDMEILHTKANVARRLAQFDEALSDPNISLETRELIKEMSEDLKKNSGKGYVTYSEDLSENLPDLLGIEQSPEQIYVLSDVYCGSSGDNFVAMMKAMPKVTVVGRPTLGILDYSNCCSIDFDDYVFVYPTSRSLAIDHGKGMTDIGVLPDLEIPWTTQHLTEDIDLKVVLEKIEEGKGQDDKTNSR